MGSNFFLVFRFAEYGIRVSLMPYLLFGSIEDRFGIEIKFGSYMMLRPVLSQICSLVRFLVITGVRKN